MLTSDQKGAIAETAVVHAAIKLGINVYRPVVEGGRYDMIFEVCPRLIRVQCKWARRHGDVVVLRCYSAREILRLRPLQEQPNTRRKLGQGLRIRRYTWAARGHSSAGRASAWHAEGRRFEPGWLHLVEVYSGRWQTASTLFPSGSCTKAP